MRKLTKAQLSQDQHFGDWIHVYSQCVGTEKTDTDVMVSFTSNDDPRYRDNTGTIDVFLTKSGALELLAQLQAWADANTTLVDHI